MAGTIFGIPFDEELFMQMWSEAPDPYLTAMIESGAVVEDPVIASKIANNGNLYSIPFYDTLDGEDQNYDGQTDITVTEVSGGVQTGVVYGRAKGFFARNFTAELSGADPMGHIVASVAKYWQKRRQKRLIGITDAVFGITGASENAKSWNNNHTLDLSSSTSAAKKIEETDLNDLATLEPEVAREWHPTLNGALTPDKVTAGSHRRVWWQCANGHVWKALIYSRAGVQKCGCPVCAGKVRQPRRADNGRGLAV